MEVCGQLSAPGSLPPGGKNGTNWIREPVWTLWREERSFTSVRIRSQGRPARSLVGTAIFRLLAVVNTVMNLRVWFKKKCGIVGQLRNQILIKVLEAGYVFELSCNAYISNVDFSCWAFHQADSLSTVSPLPRCFPCLVRMEVRR
jgi:hypothetical protein